MIDIEKLIAILTEEQPTIEFCCPLSDLIGYSIGTTNYSDSDYGNIHIRFYIKNNSLKITHLFLIKQSCGTGTKLIKFFIEQAKLNNYEKIEIVNVKSTNILMKRLCKNFQQEKINDDFVNYIYCL